jgi:hypothetical protein
MRRHLVLADLRGLTGHPVSNFPELNAADVAILGEA